jgi:hypothetical protein
MSNNFFYKNTMENIVTVEDNRDYPAYQLRLNLERNQFLENLSPDILLVDVPSANVTLNQFDDAQAKCELRTGPYRDATRIDAINNYWARTDNAEVLNGFRLSKSEFHITSLLFALLNPCLLNNMLFNDAFLTNNAFRYQRKIFQTVYF